MGDVCDSSQEEIMDISSFTKIDKSQVLQQKGKFMKETFTFEGKAYVVQTKYETRFCEAKLNAFYEDKCNIGYFEHDYVEAELKNAASEEKCLVGGTCGPDCDGNSKDECEGPKLDKWQDSGKVLETSPSQAWFVRRCHRKWECKINRSPVTIIAMKKGHIQIVLSGFRYCELEDPTQQLSCKLNTGDFLALSEPIVKSNKTVQLNCLIGLEESICYDLESSTPLILESDLKSYEGNSIYTLLSSIKFNGKHEPVFKVGMATGHDLEEVFRLLQFENLQTIYDMHVLQNQLSTTQDLAVSLLLYIMNVTENPLSRLRKTRPFLRAFNSSHLALSPCVDDSERNVMDKPLYGLISNTILSTLFPKENLSVVQIKDIKFDIEDFDEALLDRLSKDPNNNPWKEKTNGKEESNFWDFWSKFKQLYMDAVPALAGIAFVMSVYLLHLFIKRGTH